MNKRLLIATFAAASLAVMSVACGGGGTGDSAPATDDTGIPRTAEGQPDLTGAFFPNGIEDITDALAPGSEIIHTEYGEEQWLNVDRALDPNAHCLPWGPTRMICCTRMPIAFVQHEDIITILTESQQTFRLVYMDGRSIPEDLYDSEGNVDPQVGGWMGFSTGSWEGDTLVVETVGADGRTWIDGHAGHLHSDRMILTERFEMIDRNTISFTGTVDDPVHYQEPWTFLKELNRVPPHDRIMSHACMENEKDLQYMIPGVDVGPEV